MPLEQNQPVRIDGRLVAGGYTYQRPSSCLKNIISSGTVPVSLEDLAKTQRASPEAVLLKRDRVRCTGDAGVGASHLSIRLRKDFSLRLIATSMDTSSIHRRGYQRRPSSTVSYPTWNGVGCVTNVRDGEMRGRWKVGVRQSLILVA